jgi:hypothetical protein
VTVDHVKVTLTGITDPFTPPARKYGDHAAPVGTHWLVVGVAAENTGSEKRSFSDSDFRLRLTDGRVLERSYHSMDGVAYASATLEAGDVTSGQVLFAVPDEAHPEELRYQQDYDQPEVHFRMPA